MPDTFTTAEMNSQFQDVLERMLLAGWVYRFARKAAGGWHIEWTEVGLEHTASLHRIVTSLRLCEDDRGPMAFDVFTQGLTFPGASFSINNPDVNAFWSDRVNELKIRGDADKLLVFAHIIEGWSPVSNPEKLRFLPPE